MTASSPPQQNPPQPVARPLGFGEADAMSDESYIEQLDAGDRIFRAGTAEVSIKPGAFWITVRHRGGSVMMSLDEAEHVIAVIRAAREYAEAPKQGEPRSLAPSKESRTDG